MPETARFAPGHFSDPRRFEQAQLTSGYAAPGHHDPAHDAAALFTLAAGGGMSSRLFQEVREARGLAYSISAATTPYVDGGLMSVHAATARKDAAAARATSSTGCWPKPPRAWNRPSSTAPRRRPWPRC